MSNICVIGAGYVGLVTAACFAELGHQVCCLEIDPDKVNSLQRGKLPVYEPELLDLWQRHYCSGRLSITGNYQEGLRGKDFAFITVGTPSTSNGNPDLSWVRSAARSIAESASSPMTVVIKSTVPVGTAEMVAGIICCNKQPSDFPVVSNPEFLREGLAVYDFMHPTRVVVGARSAEAAKAVAALYEGLNSPIIFCDPGTSEMSKYVSNAILASRISFINEIALLCDKLGVDVKRVAQVAGMEPRCGDGYLGAGLGFGGSCLPKDLRALIHVAEKQGAAIPMIRAIMQINRGQPHIVINKLQRLIGPLNGKTVGILGLSFKPNSDDMREASSISVVALLQGRGCRVKAYDAAAMDTAEKLLHGVKFCASPYEVAEESDALVLVTEWEEFKRLDMERIRCSMKTPVLVDGRNLYEPADMAAVGFVYEGIGRCGFSPKQPHLVSNETAMPIRGAGKEMIAISE